MFYLQTSQYNLINFLIVISITQNQNYPKEFIILKYIFCIATRITTLKCVSDYKALCNLALHSFSDLISFSSPSHLFCSILTVLLTVPDCVDMFLLQNICSGWRKLLPRVSFHQVLAKCTPSSPSHLCSNIVFSVRLGPTTLLKLQHTPHQHS